MRTRTTGFSAVRCSRMLHYKLNNQWFIGINGKYQFTEDLEFEVEGEDVDANSSADNWRVGAHVGLMF